MLPWQDGKPIDSENIMKMFSSDRFSLAKGVYDLQISLWALLCCQVMDSFP